jgi:hypothetical protein
MTGTAEPDRVNTRYQPHPGLKVSDIPPQTEVGYGCRGSMYGVPVAVGGRVFATSPTGRVYSLDARRLHLAGPSMAASTRSR